MHYTQTADVFCFKVNLVRIEKKKTMIQDLMVKTFQLWFFNTCQNQEEKSDNFIKLNQKGSVSDSWSFW